MILYTMMPNELVFPTMEEDFHKQKVMEINGVSLLVQETMAREYQIVRLLSSDPLHYLNEQYMPGRVVQLNQSITNM